VVNEKNHEGVTTVTARPYRSRHYPDTLKVTKRLDMARQATFNQVIFVAALYAAMIAVAAGSA